MSHPKAIQVHIENKTGRLLNVTGTQVRQGEVRKVALKAFVLKVTVGTMACYRYDLAHSFVDGARYLATLESEQTILFVNQRDANEQIRFESVVDSNDILTSVKFSTGGLEKSKATVFRTRILTALKLLDVSLGKFDVNRAGSVQFGGRDIFEIPRVAENYRDLLGKPTDRGLVSVLGVGPRETTTIDHLRAMIQEIREVLGHKVSVTYSRDFDGRGEYSSDDREVRLFFDADAIESYEIVSLAALMFHEMTHANRYYITEDHGYTVGEIRALSLREKMDNAESMALVYQLIIGGELPAQGAEADAETAGDRESSREALSDIDLPAGAWALVN